MVALAGRLRAPFARYWLSEFLSSFGNGVRLAAFPLLAAQLTRAGPIVIVTIGVAWRHRHRVADDAASSEPKAG